MTCLAVEAGHISLPLSIVQRLWELGIEHQKFQTIEALFSGSGFIKFCQPFTSSTNIDAAALIAAYGTEDQPAVTTAIDHYSCLLGILLRDLSLAYMPSTGLYLAGSVAVSIISTSPQSCIKAFREPSTILTCNTIPIWVISDDLAALAGCAKFAFQYQRHS